MASKPNRLSTRIDFDADRKQLGCLQLPHPVHRSACGWLPVPIACVRNGEGPTVLLLSGGDEYEGQITLSKLICDLEPAAVSGRIILLPMANFSAGKAGLRTSPIDDGLNLNRVSPGDADGTPALAQYIDSVLMPMADHLIDLHSGGSSLMYLPTAIPGGARMTASVRQTRLEPGRVCAAPYSFLFPDGQGGNATTVACAASHGVISIGTEMGEAVR